MELCRRGTVILDGAEKKVETLLAAGRTAPFEHEDKADGRQMTARQTGWPRGARSWTICSTRVWPRRPAAIPAG